MTNYSKLKPREVEGRLRQAILETFGDEVENASTVTSSRGYYSVKVNLEADGAYYEFARFRKKNVGKIIKAIRHLTVV